ncbi:unnamed protein product [Oppiella nova]|uniref:Uncharacterized protein n=1 Tax=Oppiella nova TaxID=334625 RepID=A0A7R9LR29_9ACAR|nr:unnamed protein product [Oppiella nova]CAG2165388.1 unnamed protein product [Oppiella nova]
MSECLSRDASFDASLSSAAAVARLTAALHSAHNRAKGLSLVVSNVDRMQDSIVAENAIFWSQIAVKELSKNSQNATLAARLVVAVADAVHRRSACHHLWPQMTSSVAFPAVDLLIGRSLPSSFVVSVVAQLIASFGSHLAPKRKPIEAFVLNNGLNARSDQTVRTLPLAPIPSDVTFLCPQTFALLFARLFLCCVSIERRQIHGQYLRQSLDALNAALAQQNSNHVHFWSSCVAALCTADTGGVAVALPVAAVVQSAVRVLAFAPQRALLLLDALLVTARNDFLVFCPKVNQIVKQLLSSEDLALRTLAFRFLRQYFRLFGFRSGISAQTAQQFVQELLHAVNDSQNSSSAADIDSALDALRALFAAFPALDASLALRSFVALLITNYRSREMSSLLQRDDTRRRLWRLTASLVARQQRAGSDVRSVVCLAQRARVCDPNEDIQRFCEQTIRLSINRFSAADDTPTEKETPFAEMETTLESFPVVESVVPLSVPPLESGKDAEDVIASGGPPTKRAKVDDKSDDSVVEDILKDFVLN